jgi:hypothetical protein
MEQNTGHYYTSMGDYVCTEQLPAAYTFQKSQNSVLDTDSFCNLEAVA